MKGILQQLRSGAESLAIEAQKHAEEKLLELGLNPSELKKQIEIIQQFSGLKSIEADNLKGHPLFEYYNQFNLAENIYGVSFDLANFFGIIENCNLEIKNPKIHSGIKNIMLFDCTMNNNTGHLVAIFDVNKIQIEKARVDSKNDFYSAAKLLGIERNSVSHVYFISGFSAVDLTNQNILSNLIAIRLKDLLDRF